MAQDSIKIDIEKTPNPATLKFKFNTILNNESPMDFPNFESTEFAPIARKIWGFPWTTSVYIGQDFISISKQEWVSWEHIANPLAQMIQQHLLKGDPLILKPASSTHFNETNLDSEIVRNIKKIIQLEIRPIVAMDGGDIVFHDYKEGILRIQMKGACSGCPSANRTLKEGIEKRICELFPEVTEVLSI
ncbi:MAG TPA: NifU family protein [Pseudobdellovibrionaceae bacterium]|nr:NifU family protein [Pseudobdellovibrionaceae bacterium]